MLVQYQLNVRLIRKFSDVIAEVESRPTEKALAEFWNIWRAVNSAAGRLGLPHDETPALKTITPQDF